MRHPATISASRLDLALRWAEITATARSPGRAPRITAVRLPREGTKPPVWRVTVR